MSTKSPRNDNAGRNRKITKFALAGVAVLGVGAALTSAAWTDNVFFSADANSGDIELQGSVNGTDFYDGDVSGNAQLVVPVDQFGGLTPNDTVSETLWVKNNGEGVLTLQNPVITHTGDLFAGVLYGPAIAGYTPFVDDSGDGVLDPGEEASFTVTITTPNWVGDEAKDDTGSLIIQVQATT